MHLDNADVHLDNADQWTALRSMLNLNSTELQLDIAEVYLEKDARVERCLWRRFQDSNPSQCSIGEGGPERGGLKTTKAIFGQRKWLWTRHKFCTHLHKDRYLTQKKKSYLIVSCSSDEKEICGVCVSSFGLMR